MQGRLREPTCWKHSGSRSGDTVEFHAQEDKLCPKAMGETKLSTFKPLAKPDMHLGLLGPNDGLMCQCNNFRMKRTHDLTAAQRSGEVDACNNPKATLLNAIPLEYLLYPLFQSMLSTIAFIL